MKGVELICHFLCSHSQEEFKVIFYLLRSTFPGNLVGKSNRDYEGSLHSDNCPCYMLVSQINGTDMIPRKMLELLLTLIFSVIH